MLLMLSRRRSEALTVASVNQDPRQIQVPNGTIVAQYQQSQGRTIQVGGAQSPASPGQAILTRPREYIRFLCSIVVHSPLVTFGMTSQFDP